MGWLDEPLVECVPNFSEGRDRSVIERIVQAIESVGEGVRVLDVDMGATTNRTVVTFVGKPQAVVEAAFRAIGKAAELIDMRRHRGAHPRMGATDVCPLVPVANIKMEEVVGLAVSLAQRVGRELGIPVYLYEYAARAPHRRLLADIRAGEYEALPEKLKDPRWCPDFGPAEWNERIARTGATVIGARNFLIAYNVNLNTLSVRRANAVAFDVRERGRVLRRGHPVVGEAVVDVSGRRVWLPGTLKGIRAIGWFIEEYNIAQVSINITNIEETPLHVVFEEVERAARSRGLRVTGSQIVGLVPRRALVEAGRYFLRKQGLSDGQPEDTLVQVAVRSLGLNELAPFDPEKKVIEYILMREEKQRSLTWRSVRAFCNEVSVDSPLPGGGSVSALVGALAASLASMVANLSAHKHGWEDRFERMCEWARQAQELKDRLLQLVDEDARAFDKLMEALRSKDEEQIRHATFLAARVPLCMMEEVRELLPVLRQLVAEGLPSAVSDVGVACGALRACVQGAYLNVAINLRQLAAKDKDAQQMLVQARRLLEEVVAEADALFRSVEEKLQGAGRQLGAVE